MVATQSKKKQEIIKQS